MATPIWARPPRTVSRPLEHYLLDRPATLVSMKLPEKSGFFAKVDIPEGVLIYRDGSTLTAKTFFNNPKIQKILEEKLLLTGTEDKNWLSSKGVQAKYPTVASMFPDYAMPIYSLRSKRWNGADFERIGFFRFMVYFRHSCIPTAHFSYDHNNRYIAIHATRKILQGEEVTISYLPESSYDVHTFPDALEVLKNTFGRTCSCPIHTPAGFAEQLSKANFEIERKSRQLLETESYTSYTQQMTVVYRIFEVLREYQVRGVRYARVHELGLECAVSHGDLVRAVVFAWQAKIHYSKLEGAEGKNGGRIMDMHYFKNDPQNHPKFKDGGPWASRPTQVPRAFKGDKSNAAIERMLSAWLWIVKG
ncbi:hypothetical protein DL98DRAFT_602303 [Cadophora sp. DSE1049]|nr:hypothetical protein DL98DRAFT_602303 [Cadophora sp. DSE1049]